MPIDDCVSLCIKQYGLLLPTAEAWKCLRKLPYTFNASFASAAERSFQFACTVCVPRLPLHTCQAAAAAASMQHYCTGATGCALSLWLCIQSWQRWVKSVQCNAGSLSAPLTKARSTSCRQQCRSKSTSCTNGTLPAWLGRARTPKAWRTSTKPSWQNLVARTPENWVAQVSPTTGPLIVCLVLGLSLVCVCASVV